MRGGSLQCFLALCKTSTLVLDEEAVATVFHLVVGDVQGICLLMLLGCFLANGLLLKLKAMQVSARVRTRKA